VKLRDEEWRRNIAGLQAMTSPIESQTTSKVAKILSKAY
jgi:hypothetical protein